MKRTTLPPDVIDQWPEVFGDVEVRAIPLPYLYSLIITFNDGKIWDVDIASHIKKNGTDSLEAHIDELLSSYADTIDRIDFKLDVTRVKKDVIKTTKRFLKNIKQ